MSKTSVAYSRHYFTALPPNGFCFVAFPSNSELKTCVKTLDTKN